MQKIRRAAQLTFSEWHHLATAAVELLVARFRFSIVSPEIILRELQDHAIPLPPERTNRRAAICVERVSWAITLAARYVPWRSDCLIQVMAADRWLRRHDLSADFHLGVTKDANGDLKAHAWLRHGDLTVTGGRYEDFVSLIEPGGK